MCGITGLVHVDRSRAANEPLLREMTSALVHRGPDDFGIWLDGPVAFGHQRLSIIDLSGGRQPMAVRDDKYTITYNGEVYNYLELREDLEASGSRFRTRSDTEVVLQAYAEHGERCLDLLNGMFAFAIWDGVDNRLFAARDRLGIKPFYYYWDGELLAFASEIKSLLLHPAIATEIDDEGLQDYLDLQYCLGDRTLFKGIKRLAPGHSLTLDDGRLSVRQYWELDFTETHTSRAAVVEEVRELLKDAVRIRLRSDVPVGTHLSGGMDSSTVAGLASSMLDGELSVFTGGFRESQRYDESRYARMVAEHIGARYYETFPSASDLSDNFERLVYYLDEPVAGAAVFPQFFLSKLASEHVKVVLGGQGGDEIFCGYTRYLIGSLEAAMQGAIYPGEQGVGTAQLADLLPNLPYLHGYEPTLMRFFSQDLFGSPAERYYRLLTRSDGVHDVVDSAHFSGAASAGTLERFRAEFDRPETASLIDRMLYVDVKNHLQSLLHLEDRTSMAVSLESRLPLLDYRIVELLCRTPAAIRFADGEPKALLRAAVADVVPQPVLDRKDKMGFPVPIYEWFRGELRPFVEDILLGETSRSRGFFRPSEVERCVRSERPFGRTVWGLLSLELWFRCFFDKS